MFDCCCCSTWQKKNNNRYTSNILHFQYLFSVRKCKLLRQYALFPAIGFERCKNCFNWDCQINFFPSLVVAEWALSCLCPSWQMQFYFTLCYCIWMSPIKWKTSTLEGSVPNKKNSSAIYPNEKVTKNTYKWEKVTLQMTTAKCNDRKAKI